MSKRAGECCESNEEHIDASEMLGPDIERLWLGQDRFVLMTFVCRLHARTHACMNAFTHTHIGRNVRFQLGSCHLILRCAPQHQITVRLAVSWTHSERLDGPQVTGRAMVACANMGPNPQSSSAENAHKRIPYMPVCASCMPIYGHIRAYMRHVRAHMGRIWIAVFYLSLRPSPRALEAACRGNLGPGSDRGPGLQRQSESVRRRLQPQHTTTCLYW